MSVLNAFVLTYSISAIAYLWYRYGLVFAESSRKYQPYIGLVSVIIPVYNEKKDYLEKAIASCVNAKGNKEVIVVDDGSTNGSWDTISKLREKYGFKAFRQENKGKRHAQALGFRNASGDILVTVDSDTILAEDGLENIVKPFNLENVGATTGNVLVANETQNLLTKAISARYWCAFNMERKGLSAFGVVNCCSGVFSAYRKGLILSLLDDYLSQKFMNKACTYGDDRYLTNLILKKGYDILYVGDAKAYTFVPTSLRTFLKQQIRWKKSWLRENLNLSKFMLKRSGLLSFDTIITSVMPFASFLIRLLIISSIVVYPVNLLFYIAIIFIMGLLRSLLMFAETGMKAFNNIVYAYLYEFAVYWTLLIAVFTLNDTKWGTR